MAELSFSKNMPSPSKPLYGSGRGGSCPYCMRKFDKDDFDLRPTKDHTVPVSKGGKSWIWCCNQCNGRKGNMMPSEWRHYMRDHPQWWKVPSRKPGAYYALCPVMVMVAKFLVKQRYGVWKAK